MTRLLAAGTLLATVAVYAQQTDLTESQVGGRRNPPVSVTKVVSPPLQLAQVPQPLPGEGVQPQPKALPKPEALPGEKPKPKVVLTLPDVFKPVSPDAMKLWTQVYNAVAEKQVVDRQELKKPELWEDPPRAPEAEYTVVLEDIEALPETQRLTTRYLSLYAIPPAERFHHVVVTSFVLNSLSWNNQITIPEVVPGTKGRILRVNWAAYSRGFNFSTGKDEDLLRFLESWELMSTGDSFFLEPWVDSQEADQLTAASGSIGAILRADWFNFYVMLDDNPDSKDVIEGFYSIFRGLPDDEAAFFSLLKVRVNEIRELGGERRAGVVISGTDSDARKVGQNNRILVRYPTLMTPYGAYLWHTLDYINSQGKRNILNNPVTDFKDGGEYIFSNPNYLQGYFLTQRQEISKKSVFKRVSEVPIEVATDPHFDHHRVKINSCTVCHVGGINTFKDVFTKQMFAPKGPAGAVLPNALKDIDLDLYKRVYKEDLDVYVKADRINYQMAIERATGLIPEDFVPIYYKTILDYAAPVTAEKAAWEFGVTLLENDLEKSLEMYLADKVVSTTQGSLMLLVRRGQIQRDTFEEDFKWGKLLQEVKRNVELKGDRPRIYLQVPSEVEIRGVDLQSRPGFVKATPASEWKVGATVVIGQQMKVMSAEDEVGTLLIGTRIKLEDSTKQGRTVWYQVTLNGKTGYIKPPSD